MMRPVSALIVLLSAGVFCQAQSLDDAVSKYRQHRYLLAEQQLAELVKQSPGDARVAEYYALALAARKKFDEAERAIGEAERLGAAADRVAMTRARLAAARRQRAEARGWINKALEANPRNADARQLAALLDLQERDYRSAAELLAEVRELRRDEPYDEFYAALAANGLGRRRETVERLERFLRLAPDSPDVDRVGGALRAMRRQWRIR